MDVLYLHPLPRPAAFGTGDGASYPVMPMGLVALLNLLRQGGYSVYGLNIAVERTLNPSFDLLEWLRAQSTPALVLIDLHWYEHSWGAVETARIVRLCWPAMRIVLGGLSATLWSLEILAEAPTIDAVVCGPAEEPVLRLAQQAVAGHWEPALVPNVAFRDTDGQPCPPRSAWQTPASMLDSLDSVDLSFLQHATTYRAMVHSRPLCVTEPAPLGQWLLSGRGCAFACAYCGGGRAAHRSLLGLSKVARRSPAALAADCDRLARLGVQQVSLGLDPDMLGSAHTSAFFGGLTRSIGFYVESYQLPSQSLLSCLSRTDTHHSEVAITLLSGDPAVRNLHGKRADNDQIRQSVRAILHAGASVFLFYSLNMPGEDERSFQQTLDFTRELIDLSPHGRVRAINIAHTLDPLSPMSSSPDDFGISAIYLRSFADYSRAAIGPRPFQFVENERGFSLKKPRNLRAMVELWDELSATMPSVVYSVPRV